jgi:REP element-mobilizing transposase RayT
MPLWTLNYHVVWATKGREPALVGEGAELVRRSIMAGCSEQGIVVHALFVMPDHVHLAAEIPPSMAISMAIGRLKGSSSHLVNHAGNGGRPPDAPRFAWQSEYAVFAFGPKDRPLVVAYINEQPARHDARKLWRAFEQTSEDE